MSSSTEKAVSRFTMAIAQINPTVGALGHNLAIIKDFVTKAAASKADLVIFPEMAVCGYPADDLLLSHSFLDEVKNSVHELAVFAKDVGIPVLVGTPWKIENNTYNASLLLRDGKVEGYALKNNLPNYGVFDEKRTLTPYAEPAVIKLGDVKLGIAICEDMWTSGFCGKLTKLSADIIVCQNASPFDLSKQAIRIDKVTTCVKHTGLPLVYVNQVGGHDELLFDGASFVVNSDGALCAQAASWKEELVFLHWEKRSDKWICLNKPTAKPMDKIPLAYHGIIVGIRDYVNKNGLGRVVVGLSGGIDSALVATLACDALGSRNVHCLMMPSQFTSAASVEDASRIAAALECKFSALPISSEIQAFDASLKTLFGVTMPDITEENIQARIRGLLLMAVSNKLGGIVLATGNKSEIATGYATLYGDMCGGYAPLKDVYKTMVYDLAKWRNRNIPEGSPLPKLNIIPERVFTKAPSAELKANQTDQDTLPPYNVLDELLEKFLEKGMGISELLSMNYNKDTVRKVWTMLHKAEYKRRQSAPGPKITAYAFGRERRYPITNGFSAYAIEKNKGNRS